MVKILFWVMILLYFLAILQPMKVNSMVFFFIASMLAFFIAGTKNDIFSGVFTIGVAYLLLCFSSLFFL